MATTLTTSSHNHQQQNDDNQRNDNNNFDIDNDDNDNDDDSGDDGGSKRFNTLSLSSSSILLKDYDSHRHWYNHYLWKNSSSSSLCSYIIFLIIDYLSYKFCSVKNFHQNSGQKFSLKMPNSHHHHHHHNNENLLKFIVHYLFIMANIQLLWPSSILITSAQRILNGMFIFAKHFFRFIFLWLFATKNH